jgi:hypothetical protein
MEARVSGPDGREWVVRSFRFRRPPWRQFDLTLGLFDPDEGLGLVYVPLLLLALLLAPFTLLILPCLVFVGEVGGRAAWSLVASRRWVEAVHEGPPSSRMTWQTTQADSDAVAEQVTRQLEFGYDRVQPHNARFLGFR